MVAQRIEWTYCVIGLLEVQISDVRIGVILILSGKWRLAGQKLKTEDSYGPLVNFLIVRLLVHEFRRNVVDCTAECRSSLVNGMCGPAKVTQFNMHGVQVGNQNIFRLYVPMDHVPVLQVEKCFNHLGYDMSGTIFREALLPS